MSVYTLYFPIDETPLFLNSLSPEHYGICSCCSYMTITRNCHMFIGPTLDNVRYSEYVRYNFCRTCFNKYRIIRPSEEELYLRIHKLNLRKILTLLNMYLCKELSMLICAFVKYPDYITI